MRKSFLLISALLILSACGGKKVQAESADAVVTDSTEGMTNYLSEPLEETSELTYANMAGIYDSFNEEGGNESRISLMEDGTATWVMIGSLNYTEYTYTINGNTICLKVKGVESEDECYDYDEQSRTLKNEQGAAYHRQDIP